MPLDGVLAAARKPRVETDRQENYCAGDRLLDVRVHTQQDHAILQDADDGGPKDCSKRCSLASHQASATDDCRGDHWQLETETGRWVRWYQPERRMMLKTAARTPLMM